MSNVLITGANRGIGLALARLFQGRGDRVIAVCRKESRELGQMAGSEPAKEPGKENKGPAVRVETGVDVTSDESVEALSRRLGDEQLDVLVLNAGILRSDDLDGVRLEDVNEQIAVNAVGPLRVVRALKTRLRRGAKIAAITSRMGSMGDNGSGGYYGYRMSKAALNAMSVSLARDLRVAGMAVAILHPGYVRTEMTGQSGNVTAEQSARQLIARIDALTLETSGTFWHANGDVLPW
jgi:NAD(P)-dependent dehydrogenase (short-subunit alcohol dehydrogenase family)